MKLQGHTRRVIGETIKKSRWSRYPTTASEAIQERIVFYDTVVRYRCPVHNKLVKRYTLTDIPVCCATASAKEAYDKAVANMEPTNRFWAFDERSDHYWTEQPARNCGHVGKLTLDGLCYTCGAGEREKGVTLLEDFKE